jgi:fatty-acyl-CoA synthase
MDGWMHTGDIGTLDEEGYFTFIDRSKDMIISGGFNS